MGAISVDEVLKQSLDRIESNEFGYREKLDELHELQDIAEHVPAIDLHKEYSRFLKCMVQCLACPSTTMRATALRTCRYFCTTVASVRKLLELNAAYFVAMSLEKAKAADVERIQALKFVRHLSNVAPEYLPRPIVQAVVAIARFYEDPLCLVAIQTITELALKNTWIVAECNGIAAIFSAMINMRPFSEGLQETLINAMTFILNEEHTRKYVRKADIRLALEPITDTYEPNADLRRARWNAARLVWMKFLRSWTGLVCLCDDRVGLQSFVDALQLPDPELNAIVLDTLFNIFHLQLPKSTDSLFSSKTTFEDDRIDGVMVHKRHDLLENFQTALLIAFNDANLLEGLLELSKRMTVDASAENAAEYLRIANKATALVGELLHLANTLLPPSQCARLQTLSSLVKSAVTFSDDPRMRSLSGTLVSNLHMYSHIKGTEAGTRDNRLDYCDEVKKKLDWKMEENVLKQKMNESVFVKRDHTTWDWDVVTDLINGPLANPAHFNTPHGAKFIKKVLSFFKPGNKIFPLMPINRANEKFSRIGCQLLRLIMAQDSGASLLTENSFPSQIADMLREEVQAKDKGKKDTLLSREKVLKFMTKEYFTFIGELSSTTAGIDILKTHKVFNWLAPISVLPDRDDLCNLIIKNLDYNISGPSRLLLAQSLHAKSKLVRYLATRQMLHLYRSHVSDFSDWGVKLLVNQLSDEDTLVSGVALNILDEATDDNACLDSVITKKPYEALEKMGRQGKDLLLRFLSRTGGYRYLSGTSFVNVELEKWKESEYITYVTNIEHALSSACGALHWSKTGKNDIVVNPPPHLYGQLVHTQDGYKLLQENGHFEYFLNILSNPTSSNLQVRGALWVMGHIGTSRLGFKELLAKSDVLRLIVHIAETCSCPSIKGTCFYVLGLMACTRSVAKALDNLGWECQRNMNIAVPKNLTETSLFRLSSWATAEPWPLQSPQGLIAEEVAGKREILEYISSLSNNITTDKALTNLKRLAGVEKSPLLKDPRLLFDAMRLLEVYSFRLPVRRFIYQIFSAFWRASDLEALPKAKVVRKTVQRPQQLNYEAFSARPRRMASKRTVADSSSEEGSPTPSPNSSPAPSPASTGRPHLTRPEVAPRPRRSAPQQDEGQDEQEGQEATPEARPWPVRRPSQGSATDQSPQRPFLNRSVTGPPRGRGRAAPIRGGSRGRGLVRPMPRGRGRGRGANAGTASEGAQDA